MLQTILLLGFYGSPFDPISVDEANAFVAGLFIGFCFGAFESSRSLVRRTSIERRNHNR